MTPRLRIRHVWLQRLSAADAALHYLAIGTILYGRFPGAQRPELIITGAGLGRIDPVLIGTFATHETSFSVDFGSVPGGSESLSLP
jgi:hypothetical protein